MAPKKTNLEVPVPTSGNPPFVPPSTTGDDTITQISTPTTSTTPTGEKMLIDKADFEKLISTLTEQNKKIELLFDVADKSRLAKAQSGINGEPLIKTVKVSVWPDNGKFILGWRLTKNVSEIVNGRWLEDQKALLVFDDGSTAEVSLIDFYRKPVKQKAEILGRRTDDSSGKIIQMFKVRFSDGKELEVNSDYIN